MGCINSTYAPDKSDSQDHDQHLTKFEEYIAQIAETKNPSRNNNLTELILSIFNPNQYSNDVLIFKNSVDSNAKYQRNVSLLSFLSVTNMSTLRDHVLACATANTIHSNSNSRAYDRAYSGDNRRNRSSNYQYSVEIGHSKVLRFVGHGNFKSIQHHLGDSYKSKSDDNFVVTSHPQGPSLHSRMDTFDNQYKLHDYKRVGKIIKQILQGLKYFHDRNIVHNNINSKVLKFETELEDIDSNLILTDYSCAQITNGLLYPLQKDLIDYDYGKKSFEKDVLNWHAAPEIAFEQLYIKWKNGCYCPQNILKPVSHYNTSDNNHNDNNHDESKTKETFVNIMSEKFKSQAKGDGKRLYTSTQLFGMTFEDRYQGLKVKEKLKFKYCNNDDEWMKVMVLPWEDGDNPNIPLFERYLNKTARMLKSVDIWCVGAVAYDMITGLMPFTYFAQIDSIKNLNLEFHQLDERIQHLAMLEAIVSMDLKFPEKHQRYGYKLDNKPIPNQVLRFLEKCLHKDPLKRATVDELLNDAFVNGIDVETNITHGIISQYFRKIHCTFPSKFKIMISKLVAQNASRKIQADINKTFKPLLALQSKQDSQEKIDDVNSDSQSLSETIVQDVTLIGAIVDYGYDYDLACEMVDRVVNMFCTDSSKQGLNFDEFASMWQFVALSNHSDYRQRVFQVLDDNGDGFLDQYELQVLAHLLTNQYINDVDLDEKKKRQSMTNVVDWKLHAVRQIVAEIDVDTDGSVSYEEFDNALKIDVCT